MQRLAEAAIIALVTATITSWGTLMAVRVELAAMKADLQEMAQRLERIERDIYRPRWQENGHELVA